MTKTKRTKAKRKTTPQPSKEARAAADAMLAVPTALGLMAVEVEKMVQQTRQMELAVRALVLELKPELVSKLPPLTDEGPKLLVEPAPLAAGCPRALTEPYTHVRGDNGHCTLCLTAL